MPLISIGFGILLNFLGLVLYVMTGMVSLTALIPCVPGILIGICGLIGQNEARLKHAMHAAAVVGLLGVLAPLGRIGMSLSKGDFAFKPSTIGMLMMMVFCGSFLGFCVKSFIDARKARQAAANPSTEG
ncbi:MAG: hypothetical protein AAFY98_11225 [Verrucomicrobiota bacterium]